MSGFKPNMWKFKKPANPSSSLPTSNIFWEDDFGTSESADNNTTTNEKQNANNNGNAASAQSAVKEMKDETGKGIHEDRKCYKCNGIGHIKANCPLIAVKKSQIPEKKQQIEQEISADELSDDRKCFKCNEIGHIKVNCPRLIAGKTSQLPEINKQVEQDKTDDDLSADRKCFKCNETGHIKVNCPRLIAGKKSQIPEKIKQIEQEKTADDDVSGANKKKCFKCKTSGHLITMCPLLLRKGQNTTTVGTVSALKGEQNEKKTLLSIPIKCYVCQQDGHRAYACPVNKNQTVGTSDGNNITIGGNKKIKAKKMKICPHCNTYAHVGLPCSSMQKAKKVKIEVSRTFTTVETSDKKIPQDNKCTYCGVQGHNVSNCPVSKWRKGPDASESDAAKTQDFTIGKPIQTKTTLQINKKIDKKIKQMQKQKNLLNKMVEAQTIIAANQHLVQTQVPVAYINHPTATSVKIPVKPVAPVAPTKKVSPYSFVRSYPSGIPKSFFTPEQHQQIQQLKFQQMSGRQTDQPSVSGQQPNPNRQPNPETVQQTFVPTPDKHSPSPDSEPPRAYSPSDIYGDMRNESGSTEPHEGSESPDPHGQKRLSAFQRLGPVAQKKPKITINLMCNKEEAVREVVDETEELIEEYTPVHLRNDVTTSTDETVMKYLYFWPWKKSFSFRKTASYKTSKSAMLLEQEQMEEHYDKDNLFIQIKITHYPPTWSKEDVFDILLEQINVIPCFIEFTSRECKFLVIRSKPALMSIHKMGFRIRKDDVELHLYIAVTYLTLTQVDFIPRLVLRKRLSMGYDGEEKLDLHEFTLKSDLSHFIYFPLKGVSNQTDLIQLQSVIDWERLTELNLSHNRLTSVDGFHLTNTCPKLKILDLSYNNLSKVTTLLCCRNLPLGSISLQGNPLCRDYTDPAEYVKVVRMLFPTLRLIDGMPIHLKGDLPTFKKNYCVHGADNIIDKYLDIYYPLLEAQPSDRQLIEDMYDENALLTVLYRYKFIHRFFRISSINSKFVDDGLKDIVEGATSITKYINKWPIFKHDPFAFTVDVLFHNETATLVKVCGILKLTAESLAEDEHIISFSRTTLLRTSDGVEYKIINELLLWDEPSNECHAGAFQITKISSKKLYVDLEFETTPDEETKEKLVVIFSHLTEMDRHTSRRCLERKDWNLRNALDNFIQLLKLNDLSSVKPDVDEQRESPIKNPKGRARQLVSLTGGQ